MHGRFLVWNVEDAISTERKIILGIFPGGIWGCCLGYQVPKLEIKRLGDVWEKLQEDPSRYIFFQKEKNHLRL